MKLKTRPIHTQTASAGLTDDLRPLATPLQAGDWVHLIERPNPYSGDEALLLCTESDRWVAWIPNYGELRLKPEQVVR